MNDDTLSPDEFRSIQLGWIATLSQAALYDVMKDIAAPARAKTPVRSDLSPMATKDGLLLPPNTKIYSDVDASGEPVVTICYSSDPTDAVKHPYYCLSIRNSFISS
jgi:hypothetical protein